MNDITALMATMKAAAEKAIGAHERLNAMPSDGLFDASLAENAQLESDITALIAHNDASTPANVKALVGALEKAQSKATQQGNIACALFDEVTSQRQRIAELEEIATDYGMKFQCAQDRLKKMALMESRTVTVKLPEVEKWRKPDAVRAQNAYRILVANELAAAGIQAIEGEQKNG